MSEERLQEIKDSINLQYTVQEANDLHNFNIFTNEEQELVEEIERLHSIINEVRKYIENENDNQFEVGIFSDETGGFIGTDLSKGAKHILEILDKENI